MIYDFDQSIDRRGTDSVKWCLYEEDVLPMWVADMDFKAPQPVIEALKQRVEHGVYGYPAEMKELLQAIEERMFDLYGWEIKSEDILLLPEVIVGFNLACHAVGQAGDGLLIQPPVYPPFFSVPNNTQLQLQQAPLVQARDGSYQIDMQAFEDAITERTRLFLLCNPHNPVGRVFRKEELERMAETCLRHKVIIVSDEIHGDLIYQGQRHIPIASMDEDIAQQTITLIAPSKTYNVAGLKCSIGIVQNKELRNRMRNATQGLVGHLNLMGLTAALAAYRHGQEWLEQVLDYLEANRDYAYDFVGSNVPGVCMPKAEGTYLAWLDCRGLKNVEDPAKFFLEKARVALNDGKDFGSGGGGFVRLNFGCPRSTLSTGLERMRDAVAQLEQ